jgi:hypothetical protein
VDCRLDGHLGIIRISWKSISGGEIILRKARIEVTVYLSDLDGIFSSPSSVNVAIQLSIACFEKVFTRDEVRASFWSHQRLREFSSLPWSALSVWSFFSRSIMVLRGGIRVEKEEVGT